MKENQDEEAHMLETAHMLSKHSGGHSTSINKIGVEEDKSPSSTKYKKGFRLYLDIGSAILGTGVLFVHATIVNSGLLGALVAFALCFMGSIFVAEAVYKKKNAERGTEMRQLVRIEDGKNNNENSNATNENTPSIEEETDDSITYSSLLNKAPSIFKYFLILAISIQSTISMIVYMGVMKTWLSYITQNTIQSMASPSSLFTKYSFCIENGVPVLAFAVCFLLSVQPKPSSKIIIPALSCLTVIVVAIALLQMFVMLTMYPASPAVYNNMFSWTSFKTLLVGKEPSIINFFKGISMMLFAMNSYQSIPVYQSDMKSHSKSYALNRILSVEAIIAVLYTMVAVSGYYITYSDADSGFTIEIGNILTNIGQIADGNMKFDSMLSKVFKIEMYVLMFSMLFVLFSAYSWACYVLRDLVIRGFKAHSSTKKIANHKYFPQFAGVVLTASALCIVFLDLNLLFLLDVVGSYATAYVMFIPPVILFLMGMTSSKSKHSFIGTIECIASSIMIACFFGIVLMIFMVSINMIIGKGISEEGKVPTTVATFMKIPQELISNFTTNPLNQTQY
ncbi:hypothetical protein NECID01_2078 [Nematocida sp. AWRm77]|nr:hypothetical protein NECID01_2078 [Nematocida sp. AWRm77]